MGNGNGQRNSFLGPNDWERINGDVDGVLDGDGTYRDKARVVAVRYREEEEEGDDPFYGRAVSGLLEEGIVKVAHHRSRQGTGLFRDEQSGKVLNVPERASVVVLDASGTDTGVRQLRLWHEMTWDEFAIWAVEQIGMAASWAVKARGIRKVLKLRDKHPLSVTPGDACRSAGIDPRDLRIEA